MSGFPLKSEKNLSENLFYVSFSIIVLIAITISLYLAYIYYDPNVYPKSGNVTHLYITENNSLEDVITLLEKESNISINTFKQVCILSGLNKIYSGHYAIKSGANNKQLLNILRNGYQTPVKLTFHNIRTKEQLAGKLSPQIMADSASIISLLNDADFLAKYDLNPNTSIAIFIPNTYEVFWNMDAKKLFFKMKKEYDKFWNNDRKTKATSINLTPIEVITLASIVEEETNKKAERPVIAGLYLNRLRIGMALQADPTIKFAVGDLGLKRILKKHIETDSPYNTYKHRGLPPGPIRAASPNGIDAVLNYKKHNYLYMCAKGTLNGEHNFAIQHSEHINNARKYQRALNKMRIYK